MVNELTIISGGQTGADRAALDFAIARNIPHGGWCPRGRIAEDGTIPAQYQLEETESARYEKRTKRNIRDSDATVVFTIKQELLGGSALTAALADRLGKPCLHVAFEASGLTADEHARRLVGFLKEHRVRRLNVAGPRASQEPEIGSFVEQVLAAAISLTASVEGNGKC